MEYKYIGKSIIRPDAVKKVKGKSMFLDDIKLPGMLYAAILRPEHAHARILSIDYSECLKCEGVITVVTGKEIDFMYGDNIRDLTPFARDRVISRSLCYMGADIILSPSSWAVPADHDNAKEPYGDTWRSAYQPVAKEFSVWIIGVSNVGWMTGGPWQGRKCIGNSLVIGPEGKEVLKGPYGVDAETILYVDVAAVPRPARGCAWEEHWRERGGPRGLEANAAALLCELHDCGSRHWKAAGRTRCRSTSG